MNLSQQKRERMLKFLNDLKEKNKSDIDVLKEINEIETELTSKKYGLIWEEHEENVDEEMKTKIPVFTEVKDKEIRTCDNSYSFLLEGDNLHSLYLLEKTHKGSIDLIYIDPPYNTGNKDFMYNDTFVDKNDSYRHSKWLSFMNIRLIKAKKLLSNKGFIFISIDTDEFSQLKLLCDEIFGEQNFVNEIVWQKLSASKSQSDYFSNLHEKVLIYRKSEKGELNKIYTPVDENDKSYPYMEKETGKKYGSFDFTQKGQGEGKYFGDKFLEPPKGKHWIWSQENINEGIKKGLIIFTKNGTPRVKKYLENKKGNLIGDIWIKNGVEPLSANDNERVGFETQKPLSLLYRIIDSLPNASIILDFFAGSGTTGCAVMNKNCIDNKNRTFILCTNNENNICEDFTYPRLKSACKSLNLKYYKTDFIEKSNINIDTELNNHTKELVQLENAVDIDDKTVLLAFDNDDLTKRLDAIEEIKLISKLYISRFVMLNSKQKKLLKNVHIEVIPDYYFKKELKENGLDWR